MHFIPKTLDAKISDEQVSSEQTAQRLDAIYNEEPLGFEKDPMASSVKMLAQDPLEEVDLGDGCLKRVTYISAKLDPYLKTKVVALLKEIKIVSLGTMMRCLVWRQSWSN